MYVLIREEDGNLFAHDLMVRAYDSKADAIADMELQFAATVAQPWAGDSSIDVGDEMPYAYVADKRGCGWEWRVVRPQEMVKRRISYDEVASGIEKGVIRIADCPTGGTMCSIGTMWFWFGGEEAEGLTAAEYLALHDMPEIVADVTGALECFEDTDEDEWWYYRNIIDEMGC